MKNVILLQVSRYEIKNDFIKTIFKMVIKEELGVPLQDRLLLDDIFENMNICSNNIDEEDNYYKWMKDKLEQRKIIFEFNSKYFYDIKKRKKYYELPAGNRTCYITTLLTDRYKLKTFDDKRPLIAGDILWKMKYQNQ